MAQLKNSTSIFPKIIIKVFTSNLFTSHHCLFLQQILFLNIHLLATIFFDFFPLPTTLASHPLFFDVGWLNFSSLICTISLFCSQNLNIVWKKQTWLVFKEILCPLHYKGSSYVRSRIPSYWAKCIAIGYSQRWPMVERGSPHPLNFFIPPSLWLWVISMIMV